MRVLGVDPGSVSGAVALLGDGGALVADVPTVSKRVNAAALARLLRDWGPDCAAVELVGSFPGQGIASAFNFGHGAGTIIGVLGALEIPISFYVPSVWKKHYGLVGKRDDPDAGRQRAIELFPTVAGLDLKKHHGRADALLIANFHRMRA